MPWSPPGIPVSGTTITVAFATALINTGLNWLRQLTGGADPTAADQIIRSTSTSTSVWGKATTNVIDDAAITDVKLANQKVNWTNPQYTTFGATTDKGSGFFDITSTPGDSPVPATLNWLVNQVRHWNHGADYRWQLTCDLSNSTQIWSRSVIAGAGSTWHRMFHSGMDGAGSGIDADLLDGVQGAGYALAANGVPSGLGGFFASAAGIAAGWTRYTNLDGRIPVGAGTTFGQTWVEGASAGSSWAHQHDGSTLSTAAASGGGSVASGGGASADVNDHTHGISGNTANTTWIPPSFGVVWATKT